MTRTEELIAESQNGSQEALTALIQENAGLIWAVTRRYMCRGTDIEDLYQLGCVGFLKAVSGFDLKFGTQFSTYAVPKIAGEIRRFLRDDGAVKVSRGMKERAAQIHHARTELISSLDREPSITEISAATGLSSEEIAEAELAVMEVESIQEPSGEGGFTLENTLSDDYAEEDLIEKISLKQALNRLPEKESMVIRLRYYHGLTQQQTAQILQVSQVQVSRVEKKALTSMRSYLEQGI